MSVVHQIARKVRQLKNDLSCDIGMTVGRDENGEARRSEQRRHEFPCCCRAPRPSHDPWVGCYAQKLIEYPPGRIPSVRPRPLALEPVAAGDMKLRVSVRGKHKDIGIDCKH